MLYGGWPPYGTFPHARPPQYFGHLLRRCHESLETATRRAVCFPWRVHELSQAGRDLRDRPGAGQVSDHGLAVAGGQLLDVWAEAVFLPKSHAVNERFAQQVWNCRRQLFTSLGSQSGRHHLAGRVSDPLRRHPAQAVGRQPDLDGRPSAVGADVRVAELPAAEPLSRGLLESTPAGHGCPGPAPVTLRTQSRTPTRRWVHHLSADTMG